MKYGNIRGTRAQSQPLFRYEKSSLATHPFVVAVLLSVLIATPIKAQNSGDNQPFLPSSVRSVSTVPATGDENPYGVAFVPRQFPTGTVNPGDILVSNFNNGQNLQGTGTSIMRVPAAGQPSVFFQGLSPLGLSTALTILQKGFVLVGNFPSSDGTCGNSTAGSILVINSSGKQIAAITDASIDGPWDSALFDQGDSAQLFVANGLSGTIVRLDLKVNSNGVTLQKATEIASGYQHQCDPVTFVDAPTGLVYDPRRDVLYVASTEDNAVFVVSDAASTMHDKGEGRMIYQDATHLHGALAMAMAPNGHLLVSNNDAINSDPNQPSEIVEFTIEGKFVKELSVDPSQGGAFGLAVAASGDLAQLAAVDDVTNTLLVFAIPLP
jgi:hypothetical protein